MHTEWAKQFDSTRTLELGKKKKNGVSCKWVVFWYEKNNWAQWKLKHV